MKANDAGVPAWDGRYVNANEFRIGSTLRCRTLTATEIASTRTNGS